MLFDCWVLLVVCRCSSFVGACFVFVVCWLLVGVSCIVWCVLSVGLFYVMVLCCYGVLV